jgi:hypothetical protein
MPRRRSEESQMQETEERRRLEDSTRPVKIHHVVVLEEPEVAGHSLYLGSLGQEQNCCDWRGAKNDFRGQEKVQGLRCHLCHEHRQEGNCAWQITVKGSHKLKKARLAQQEGGYSERFQSEKGMGG